jgi:uncharacterized protein (UPF0335 family)
MALSPETSSIVFFAGLLSKQEELLATVRKAVRDIKRRARRAGINPEMLAQVLKLRDLPPEAVLERWSFFQRYSRALEMPIGYQMRLFDNVDPTTPDQAERLGFVRGLQDRDPDHQFDHQTDLGRRHMRGWDEGQRELTARILESSAEKGPRNGKSRPSDPA